MKSAFNSLLVLILLLVGACAHVQERPAPEKTAVTDEAWPDQTVALWASCSRAQVEQWATEAKTDPRIGLKAASCLVTLINTGQDSAKRLEDARLGRKLAQAAAQKYPQSGLAHYLTAYLTALEAQNNTLAGLTLVREIERSAQLAAKYNPHVDHAGPARMLGELYLRAPEPPVSIGDLDKALAYYREAVSIDPGWAENRAGLVEALIEDGQADEACSQLTILISNLNVPEQGGIGSKKIADLVKELCALHKP